MEEPTNRQGLSTETQTAYVQHEHIPLNSDGWFSQVSTPVQDHDAYT